MTGSLGHGPQAPMGGTFGACLKRFADRARDLVVSGLARRARPWLAVKTVQAVLGKTIAPCAHRVLADPELLGDLLVQETIGGRQHNACPICTSLDPTSAVRNL